MRSALKNVAGVTINEVKKGSASIKLGKGVDVASALKAIKDAGFGAELMK